MPTGAGGGGGVICKLASLLTALQATLPPSGPDILSSSSGGLGSRTHPMVGITHCVSTAVVLFEIWSGGCIMFIRL